MNAVLPELNVVAAEVERADGTVAGRKLPAALNTLVAPPMMPVPVSVAVFATVTPAAAVAVAVHHQRACADGRGAGVLVGPVSVHVAVPALVMDALPVMLPARSCSCSSANHPGRRRWFAPLVPDSAPMATVVLSRSYGRQ